VSNTERIIEQLKAISPAALCDDCLSERSGVEPRQQVNQICRHLASQGKVLRKQDQCSQCGGNKIVNSAAVPAPPPTSPPWPSLPPPTIDQMRRTIVRFCQRLWDLHQDGPRPRGLADLIRSLMDGAVIPSHIATAMHTIRSLRNNWEYEDHWGPHEADMAEQAWAIVREWAEKADPVLWRESTRPR